MTDEEIRDAWAKACKSPKVSTNSDAAIEMVRALLASSSTASVATKSFFEQATKRCDMGVGCDEVGICYAEANGDSSQCPKHFNKSSWKLVPIEPTMDMLIASRNADKEYQNRMGLPDYIGVGGYDHWCAMIEASPVSTASVSEPDNSDAELGAYVRRLVQELSDSPKSFLYQVQRAISDQSQANSQAVAQDRKEIL